MRQLFDYTVIRDLFAILHYAVISAIESGVTDIFKLIMN